MTSHDSDWTQWGQLWREQPAADPSRLLRQVARKRWRMRAMVAVEALGTCVAFVQCLRMYDIASWRWRAWGGLMLLFVLAMQALYLHIRRGTWRASGSDVHSLLALTLRRAQAGIRLARLNLWSTVALAVFTLLVAWPELEPGRWEADPRLRLTLLMQFVVNTPLIVALVAVCAWYIRRQKARIARMRTWLASGHDGGEMG